MQARARINGNITKRVKNCDKDFKRVQTILDIDGEQQYMKHLNEVVAAGRASLSMYAETSKTGASSKKKILKRSQLKQ